MSTPEPVTITLEITQPGGSVDVYPHLVEGTLSWETQLSRRAKASFTLFDPGVQIQRGDEVLITVNGSKEFGGTVERIDRESRDVLSSTSHTEIRAIDYNEIADRHLVAASFIDQTPETPSQFAGDIVRQIMQDELSQDGVTELDIQDGPSIVAANFNYVTVTKAFDDIARQTGFTWRIDSEKRLSFFDRSTFTAPFDITPASRRYRRARIRSNRFQYRNVQLIRGGRTKTDVAEVQTFKGDGETETFPLRLPVAEEPSIEVNIGGAGFVSQTVGRLGIDEPGAFQWFWQEESNEISQDVGDDALTSNDVLRVTYIGFFPILVQFSDDAEIEDRKIDGGGGTSGLYEEIETDRSINDVDVARFKAEGLLRSLGRFQNQASIQTHENGIVAGQLQVINLPELRANATYLIESTRTKELGRGYVRTEYTAVDGEQLGGWPEFFKRLALSGNDFTIRENEILLIIRKIDSRPNGSGTIWLSDSNSADESNTLLAWQSDKYTRLFVGQTYIGMTLIGEPTYP